MRGGKLALAFLKRDLRQELSYRLNFLWQVGSMVFSIAVLYFLSRMLSENPPAHVVAYGADYFAFAVIGYAFAEAMWSCLSSFSMKVRYDQMVGTLEAMMATPTEMRHLIVCSGIYPLLFSGIRIILFFAGALVLGADFGARQLVLTVPVLALTLVTFGALGLVSASMTLVLKRGDPVAAFFGAVSFLLGGTVYPVAALPEALQWFSQALPITHSIEATRRIVLSGQGLADVASELWTLAGFAVAFSLLALLAVRWAVAFSRHGGIRTY